MKLLMPVNELLALITKQIDSLFILQNGEKGIIDKSLDEVLERLNRCFSKISNKYYSNENDTIFNPYHSAQYGIFLYYLSNTIWKQTQNAPLCSKLYFLNKSLNSVELYYETEMPDIFIMEHPLGSVMGRAKYSNYFSFSQGCTIGGNNGQYPVLGQFVTLYANATVIGNSRIGNNVAISTGCLIKDQDIPDNSIVFGASPNLTIKQKDLKYMQNLMCDRWKI